MRIAVAAPLLVAMGVDKPRAVALPLIGYHWAVGFGSMRVLVLHGRLDRPPSPAGWTPAGTHELAVDAAILLGMDAMLSGVAVAVMYAGLRGRRQAWPMLVTVGPAMALTQAVVVRIKPGIGSLSAGAVALGLSSCSSRSGGGCTAGGRVSTRRYTRPRTCVALATRRCRMPS